MPSNHEMKFGQLVMAQMAEECACLWAQTLRPSVKFGDLAAALLASVDELRPLALARKGNKSRRATFAALTPAYKATVYSSRANGRGKQSVLMLARKCFACQTGADAVSAVGVACEAVHD